jgi:hypothetical protein
MNHPIEPCQCHSKSLCSTCAYYIALYRRKRAIKAILRDITGAVLTAALVSGTMAATRASGLVLQNTVNVAAATLAVKQGFITSESHGLWTGCASPQGWRRGYVHVLNTPSTYALQNAAGGYQSHVGA